MHLTVPSMVVTPPTAALRVSERMSSARGRKLPGCVWGSTRPGSTWRPLASSVARAGGSSPGRAIAAILPSATPTSAAKMPQVVTSVPPTTAVSSMAGLPIGGPKRGPLADLDLFFDEPRRLAAIDVEGVGGRIARTRQVDGEHHLDAPRPRRHHHHAVAQVQRLV